MARIKMISIPLLLIIIIAIVPLNTYAINKDYADHWAENTIQTWLDNNYVSGYPDGSFKPDEPITRAEFITIVNNLLGYTDTTDISFIDVNPNDWYYKEVQKAYKAGYISGVSEYCFNPNNDLTREQAAVIVSKILGLKINPDNVQAVFIDDSLISDWAKEYVNAAAVAQIVLGYSIDNTFRPQSSITRAEAIILLDRMNQIIIEDLSIPEAEVDLPPSTGGGGGGGGGPIAPTPIDMSVVNSTVIIGINEEFNLINNLDINTSDLTLTFTSNDLKGAYSKIVNDKLVGITQGSVTVTIEASKPGFQNKSVDFQIIVAPVLISWSDPSGNKAIGQEQDITIDLNLLEGVDSVTNVAVNMVWEKYVDKNWIVVDEEDITIICDSKEVTMVNGIYQLINGITVNKDTEDIEARVLFSNLGEYKLSVYCIKE